MVFVHLTDENTLVVHRDAVEAIRACEGIDVEDGTCIFFDSYGQPLRTVFDKPNERGRFTVVSGRYHLAPGGDGRSLLELLPSVTNVEGKDEVRTLEDVRRLLTAQCTGRAPNTAPAGDCER
jgi:hypothetical protein